MITISCIIAGFFFGWFAHKFITWIKEKHEEIDGKEKIS